MHQEIEPVLNSLEVEAIKDDSQSLEKSFGKKNQNQNFKRHQHQIYNKIQKEKSYIERAKDIMTRKVVTIQEQTTLKEIQLKMTAHKIHHLPVMGDEGLLVGIVSDRDLFKHLDSQKTAAEIMSQKLIIALDSTPIKDIAQVFILKNISAVPIINMTENFVGIVTHRDILKCLMQKNILQNFA
jgi:acetoin utilization protein AcuB